MTSFSRIGLVTTTTGAVPGEPPTSLLAREAIVFTPGLPDKIAATAELPLGPFRMAAIMKCPVLFMAGLYRGGNRYDIHFETRADFSAVAPRGRTAAVHEAMTRYAALLEEHCRMAPYNWFNFFDFWQAPAPRAASPSAESP